VFGERDETSTEIRVLCRYWAYYYIIPWHFRVVFYCAVIVAAISVKRYRTGAGVLCTRLYIFYNIYIVPRAVVSRAPAFDGPCNVRFSRAKEKTRETRRTPPPSCTGIIQIIKIIIYCVCTRDGGARTQTHTHTSRVAAAILRN